MKVAMIVAEQGKPCGVRDYTEILCGAMPQDVDVKVYPVQTPREYTPRHRLLSLLSARREITRVGKAIPDADLVHVQYADFGWNGVRMFEDCYDLFSRQCKLPLVITLHEHPWFRDDHTWDSPGTAADAMFSALAGHGTRPSNIARDILLRHRGIHVHHEWQKKTLTEDGVPDECVKVVPFPIYEFPETGSRSGALRNRFNLGSKRILSMVGFVFDRKRHDRAIEVLPHLPEDVVLCLLGGPNNPVSEKYCERLREQAKALGVESRLVITGYLCMEDLNAGLAASELVLAPYGEVSSSASICRAVACNVPIIAAKSASFVEMADGGAGIMTVDAMSTGTLIKEVLRILDDPDYAEEFRKRNREYANKYSVDSFAKTVGRWYEQCLDG